MRVMPIRVYSGKGGLTQMKASFKKNWTHYLQEALGLGVFMISACFFGALLFSSVGSLHLSIENETTRNVIIGILMGFTALFIFYSPFTAPSGSQINPAVTISFLRLGKMYPWDAMFYVIFQVIGGTLAVYLMQLLMGHSLTTPPVNSAATVPGKYGQWPALVVELIIAFITMAIVLFSSEDRRLKKYTRIVAGCLVCTWVIVAGPISGFGMNPARSFASALPANIWTAFWIYLFVPFAGMLSATELFLFIQKNRSLNMPNKKEVEPQIISSYIES
ncbi:MAG: aquaporin family protein [Bacteroidetes bacterium]|nr:MAG: aquaporin family protein [Bacteroidota bacterium]